MNKRFRCFLIIVLFMICFLPACSNTQHSTQTTHEEAHQVENDWSNPEDDMVYYDVNSSAFSQVGYSSKTQTLDVCFWNSGWYRYTGISQDLFNQFLYSDSLGSFYNDYIKGQYPCVEL